MIVVVGASGTLGPLLVPLLVGRGEPVRVVTRDPHGAAGRLTGVDLMTGDVTNPEDARRAVEGARVVVSAITGFGSPSGVMAVDQDGNRTLVQAAAAAKVEHFILLSVGGASANHPIPLFRAKFAAEEAVRASGMAWTMIRPSAYLETWLGIIGGPLVATGKTLVFGRGENPINFVSALDVARFVDLAIGDPTKRGQVVEIVGPANLTLNQLVGKVERASGRTGRVSHSPRAIMRLLSVVLRPINGMRAGQVQAALVMDTTNMALDVGAAQPADPANPLSTAADVGGRMFGHTAPASVAQPAS
jgi:uncharacterized protein YbjT (DUF2867 family)